MSNKKSRRSIIGSGRTAARALLIAGAIGSGAAFGETISTDLNIPSSSNSLTMTITANLNAGGSATDTKTATVSGNVLANFGMVFDPTTQALSSVDTMELTGGRIQVSDTAFRLSFGPFGAFGRIDIANQNVGGTFDTPNPPGLVTLNSFNAADHQTIFDQGTITATGSGLVGGFLTPNPTVIDLTAQPIGGAGSGSGTIVVTAPTISANTAVYGLTLTMPVNFDEVVFDDPTAGTVSFKAIGTMTASGSFTRLLPPPNPTWNVDGGGSWGKADNWSPAGVPNAAGTAVYFTSKLSAANAPAVITLDGDRTVGQMFLRNVNQYQIAPGSGGSLILDNSGAGAFISADSGSHIISAGLVLADNTTIETNVSSALSATGGITAAAGKSLIVKGPGITTVRGGLVVDEASSVSVQQSTLNADRLIAGILHIGAGSQVGLSLGEGKTSAVHQLDLASGPTGYQAKLDLTDGRLVILADAASAQAVLDRTTDQIRSARNSGTTLWQGNGITTSAATDLTTLGVMRNVDAQGKAIYSTFDGASVDTNSVLVRYTLNGDADLNGILDGSDYFFIDKGYLTRNSDKPLTGWHNGDFNYDGQIDGSDYFLIDKAYLSTRASAATVSLGTVAVPEPAAGSLILGAGLLLVRRRRR